MASLLSQNVFEEGKGERGLIYFANYGSGDPPTPNSKRSLIGEETYSFSGSDKFSPQKCRRRRRRRRRRRLAAAANSRRRRLEKQSVFSAPQF